MDDLTSEPSQNKTMEDNVKNNNPTGKGGFGDHPEHRSDGSWHKENSFVYWMNHFKAMSVEEFKEYERTKSDKDRTMAEMLAYARVFKARVELKEFQEVANRTEGMPKQPIENLGESFVKTEFNLYKILVDLDDESRRKINKRLLEFADEQRRSVGDGLPNRPLSNDRKGDLPAEGNNEKLEVGKSSPGVERPSASLPRNTD